jgi:hypothetical protein
MVEEEIEIKTVSGKQSISYRNYRRARDRALVRLAHLYPEAYKQLLGQEKDFDEQEGKKWFGIDTNNVLRVGIATKASGADSIIGINKEEGDTK